MPFGVTPLLGGIPAIFPVIPRFLSVVGLLACCSDAFLPQPRPPYIRLHHFNPFDPNPLCFPVSTNSRRLHPARPCWFSLPFTRQQVTGRDVCVCVGGGDPETGPQLTRRCADLLTAAFWRRGGGFPVFSYVALACWLCMPCSRLSPPTVTGVGSLGWSSNGTHGPT